MTHPTLAGLAPAVGIVRPANSQAPSQHAPALGKPSLEELAGLADEWVNRLQDIRGRHLMTHPKTAGLAPAAGLVRPVASPIMQECCTLEPCTKCRQMAVCMPVAGRKSDRTYPYCVERCWPLARDAGETVVRAEPAA